MELSRAARDLAELLLPPARLGPARGSQHRDAITWRLWTRVTGRFLCTRLYTSTSSGHPCDNVAYVLCCVGRNGLRFSPCPGSGPERVSREPVCCGWRPGDPPGFWVLCARLAGQAASLGTSFNLLCCCLFLRGFFLTTKAMNISHFLSASESEHCVALCTGQGLKATNTVTAAGRG